MLSFKVRVNGSVQNFEISGSCLINAVKNNFDLLLRKSDFYHVSYRNPIFVSGAYKNDILGGKGGLELNLMWVYSDNLQKCPTIHSNKIWIYADQEDITQDFEFLYTDDGIDDVCYLKSQETGTVMNFVEWRAQELKMFSNLYFDDEDLSSEFKTLADYLDWNEERGNLYDGLVQCDKNGNLIENF